MSVIVNDVVLREVASALYKVPAHRSFLNHRGRGGREEEEEEENGLHSVQVHLSLAVLDRTLHNSSFVFFLSPAITCLEIQLKGISENDKYSSNRSNVKHHHQSSE